MWLHPYPSPRMPEQWCADLHLHGRQIADTDYLRSGNAARQQQGQQCMPCRGRHLCGKHALLQDRPHQRGKLYSAEKELPLHREYQGGKQCGICHGSSSTYGRQDAGDSNKRIGRSLGWTDSSRVGNDNHASKPGSMVADAEMPGSTGTIILL